MVEPTEDKVARVVLGVQIIQCSTEIASMLHEQLKARAYDRTLVVQLHELAESYAKFVVHQSRKEIKDIIESDDRIRAIVGLGRLLSKECAESQVSSGGTLSDLLAMIQTLEK